MPGNGWAEVVAAVALVAAFGIAAVATPAGVSGAVLLLPFRVSVPGTPRSRQTGGRLALTRCTSPDAG